MNQIINGKRPKGGCKKPVGECRAKQTNNDTPKTPDSNEIFTMPVHELHGKVENISPRGDRKFT